MKSKKTKKPTLEYCLKHKEEIIKEGTLKERMVLLQRYYTVDHYRKQCEVTDTDVMNIRWWAFLKGDRVDFNMLLRWECAREYIDPIVTRIEAIAYNYGATIHKALEYIERRTALQLIETMGSELLNRGASVKSVQGTIESCIASTPEKYPYKVTVKEKRITATWNGMNTADIDDYLLQLHNSMYKPMHDMKVNIEVIVRYYKKQKMELPDYFTEFYETVQGWWQELQWDKYEITDEDSDRVQLFPNYEETDEEAKIESSLKIIERMVRADMITTEKEMRRKWNEE